MKWRDTGRSSNLEDRRGGGGGRKAGIGIAGIVLALVISAVTGANPLEVLGVMSGGAGAPRRERGTR